MWKPMARTTKGATKKAAKKTPAKKAAAKKSSRSASGSSTKKNSKKTASKKKSTTNRSRGSRLIKENEHFSVEFLEQQRGLLLEERSQYMENADRLKAEADELAADREPGDVQFDEESGEGDTIAVERERDLALSAQARENVAEIDAALARIANGTYGICEVSGQPIPHERLEAIPHTRVRVEYKAARLGAR